ncbi:hypothetical protein NDU88_004140 [Pleurodeles waltl]|uniref:Uncharacterized protein n=1 Tax=Pleurodeles waltl TaxID=8319 RepID=A0AAV7WT93_PLEWA|nr:hypothetical protein NDU88_004140 [Pleurodeles waltl]
MGWCVLLGNCSRRNAVDDAAEEGPLTQFLGVPRGEHHLDVSAASGLKRPMRRTPGEAQKQQASGAKEQGQREQWDEERGQQESRGEDSEDRRSKESRSREARVTYSAETTTWEEEEGGKAVTLEEEKT